MHKVVFIVVLCLMGILFASPCMYSKGGDSATIQELLDNLPDYQSEIESWSIIDFGNKIYTLDDTVTIDKKVILRGGKFVLDTPLGFEVYDGDLNGTYPNGVTFENMVIEANSNDAIKFRYCNDWRLSRVGIYNAKHAVILERTQGDAQLMLNCDLRGTTALPAGDGLIDVITPSNGFTNSFTVISSVFNVDTDRYVFDFEPQYDGHQVFNVEMYDTYLETGGKFMKGELIYSSIIGGGHDGQQGSYDLSYGEGLYIRPKYASNMSFANLQNSTIELEYIQNRDTSQPLISIGTCGVVDIQVRYVRAQLNPEVPYILIGANGGYYGDIRIHNTGFFNGGMKAAIEFGDSGRWDGNFVENCIFRNLNSDSQYQNCYALYYNGQRQIAQGNAFYEFTYYDVINNTEGFIFQNNYGYP